MIIEFNGKRPSIAKTAYIAPTAVIIGDVTIGDEASVWFGAVIRGDEGKIMIGPRTSVQDNVVLHVNSRSDTIIESDVTIGHGVVMEGCHIGVGALIGMNATVLSGAEVAEGALVAAGAVVGEGQQVPAESLATGVPAEIRGPLSERLKARLAKAPEFYVKYGRRYQTAINILDNDEQEN
ncbi:MAG: gamma carbonic anhydrase family protein [Chloroflexi bacterium]|nr:MAG: gamma carbonic anhydrase family protein [Chloroflexota bacterium]